MDNKETANVLNDCINILKREEHNVIYNNNESHLNRDGLLVTIKSTIALSENFNADSNGELKHNDINFLLTSTFEYLINANSNLNIWNFNSSNDGKESVRSILKSLRSNHPQKIITSGTTINSIRYKFDILQPMLTEVLDILMITETELDDAFP